MKRELLVTIPGKAVPKARARMGRGGHWHTPQRTIDYEEHVGWHAVSALARLTPEERKSWPKGATFHVALRVVTATARAQDVDNIAKSILDGCNQILWDDDAQISKLTVERAPQSRSPHVVMRVTALEA